MRALTEIIMAIFILIGIYLFLSKGSTTVKIIDTIAKNSIRGIEVLQGRG